MKKIIALLILVLTLGLVSCGGAGTTQEDADRAADYIYQLYKDKEVITADTELPTEFTLPANGQVYTIEWTVTLADGATEGVKISESDKDKTVVLDIDEEAAADVSFTLTLTVKDASGKTASKTINSMAPKKEILSWQEFYDTEDGKAVVIEGVVTGIVECSKENDLYLEDEDGGYFVYNMDVDPSEMGLKIGMTVRVSGIRGAYSGIAQVTDATVEIIDNTVKTVTPTDITEIFKNAEDLTVDELFLKQSMFVTIKGATILGQNLGNETYFDFNLGGKTAYVRISTSTSMLTDEQDEAFRKTVADNIGKNADITGLVSVYGGKIYLVPVDDKAFDNITIAERTPQEQVDFEKTLLANYDVISANGTTTLESAGQLYGDVTITWALDKAYDFASIVDGKLVVTLPAAETVIKLTATLKNGDATATAEYEVTVKAAPTVVAAIVTAPVKDTAYKFYLTQKKLDNTVLYFAGEMDGDYYLAATDDVNAAVDVYLEDAGEGAYRLYFMDGQLKTYISIYEGEKNDGTKTATLQLVTQQDRAITYVYNTVVNTLTATLSIGGTEKTYYIGTFNNYDTFSLSETSFILEDGAAKPAFDTSSFATHFGILEDAPAAPSDPTAPAAPADVTELKVDTEYFISSVVGKGNTYFSGTLTKGRLDGTTDVTKAVAIKLEATATAGQYYITFVDANGTKQYIGANSSASGKTAAFVLKTTADETCVWNVDVTAKTIISASFANRGFATQVASDYTNFSTYSTSNFGSDEYDPSWFVAAN